MAHKSSIKRILAGVYTALNVAGFTDLSPGLGSFIPRGSAFPYTRIGDSTENRDDAMGQPGKDTTVNLHIFSRDQSDDEALGILDKAVELLHYAVITVADHVLVAVQYDTGFYAGTESVWGKETRHWVGVFRVTVRES